MRHLLLAIPLLVLASACTEPCTAPVLTVSWRFTQADGSSGARCLAAGVETLDLWIDGARVGAGMACDQGSASFAGLAAGSHAFTLRGYDASGVSRYQTWGETTLAACGETRAAIDPGAGTLRVAYPLSTGLCTPEGDPTNTGYVWFQLLDRTTGETTTVLNASHNPTGLLCRTGAQSFFELDVPWGLYRLRWIQVVTQPTSVSPVPFLQYCPDLAPPPNPPIDVDVVTTGRTTLTVPVSPPVVPCVP